MPLQIYIKYAITEVGSLCPADCVVWPMGGKSVPRGTVCKRFNRYTSNPVMRATRGAGGRDDSPATLKS